MFVEFQIAHTAHTAHTVILFVATTLFLPPQPIGPPQPTPQGFAATRLDTPLGAGSIPACQGLIQVLAHAHEM